MRTLNRPLVLGVASLVSLGAASTATAQVDVEPPMPNVMLMIDTSGSMLQNMDGTDLAPGACTYNAGVAVDNLRWFALVQALTGNVTDADIGCESFDRSTTGFTTMFGTGTADNGYYLPHLQILSDGCGVFPGAALGTTPQWHDFPADAFSIEKAPSAPGAGTTCTEFRQQATGLIDVYKRRIRFGLMTFDPLVDPDTGITGPSGNDAVISLVDGHDGAWSYWNTDASNNWFTGSRVADETGFGRPAACATYADMEVGARGPGAPPWEGRLMGFGYETATSEEVAAQNERIEKVITSMRPYGATPLSGMMSDLRDLILEEDRYIPSADPTRPSYLGAKAAYDTLWQEGAGCRPFHVILVTDGEPNLDLRPDCGLEDTSGSDDGDCPFPPIAVASYFDSDRGPTDVGKPYEEGLVNFLHDDHGIIFHVVGIGVYSFTHPTLGARNCSHSDYTADGGGRCEAADRTPEERTCCILNTIQYVGNGSDMSDADNKVATYASTADEVEAALKIVLAEIATGTATRTTSVFQATSPTFAPGGTAAAGPIVGHEVRAALETVVGDGMWQGRLDRARYACVDPDGAGGAPPAPELQPITETLGDDFASNVRKQTNQRKVFTVTPSTPIATNEAWRTLRPNLTATFDDGIGLSAVQLAGGVASAWVNDTNVHAAMDVDVGSCAARTGAAALPACAVNMLTWYTGQTVGTSELPDRVSPLGAIYHSQPVLVGPPREFVRDEAYDEFARTYRNRPSVVYAATVDGQLHAFMMADNTGTGTEAIQVDLGAASFDAMKNPINQTTAGINNELWTFVPPIVLPQLEDHLNRHALLLDGAITVRNIPEERLPTDAAAGTTYRSNRYRTMLVASSGRASQVPGGGYYFALDVTQPRTVDNSTPPIVDTDFSDPEDPKFLWQLARTDGAGDIDDAGTQLFGESLPAAAVTTILYADPAAGDALKEIPVAILAGGISGGPDPGVVTNDYQTESVTTPAGSYDLFEGSTPTNLPRIESRNWAGSRADRSLSIVRVDTGEILMRFRGQLGDPDGGLDSTRVRTGKFFAPMSGTPVAYPGLPGQVSTRAFIGDADGILWALDLSDANPANWKLQIAWDTYSGLTAADSAPIEVTPIISVNDDTDPVVIFASGSQADFYVNSGKNFVVSLQDTPATPGYELNWKLDLEALNGEPGQRVTGDLNLFNGVVYFATFVPNGDSCLLGDSRVFALDYVEREGASVYNPVQPGFDFNGDTLIDANDRFVDRGGDIIFGVAIGQQPSCKDGTSTNEDDEIFGGYSSFQSAPPGSFELVFYTGRTIPNVGELNDDVAPPDPTILRVDLPIPAPPPVTRVDSWATVVD